MNIVATVTLEQSCKKKPIEAFLCDERMKNGAVVNFYSVEECEGIGTI